MTLDADRSAHDDLAPVVPAPSWMKTRVRERGLLFWGCVIALGTITLQSAGHLVGVLVLEDRFWNLNADEEGNVLAWVGSASLFMAALAALVFGLVRERPDRRALALACILAVFSADDAISIHERIARSLAARLSDWEGLDRLLWPLVYLPLFVVALLLLFALARSVRGAAARAILAGTTLLVVAIGAELASAGLNRAGVARGDPLDALQVVIEEGAEVCGALLIATGLGAAAAAQLRPARWEPQPTSSSAATPTAS